MNEDREIQLVEKYPIILKDWKGDPKHTCMAWGIAVGEGWYDIVDTICQDATDIIGNKNIKFVADQIKEKFGGLRFYYHVEKKTSLFDWFEHKFFRLMVNKYWQKGIMLNKIRDFRKKYLFKTIGEKLSDVVDTGENMSYETCEQCGKPGKRVGGGWVRTICEECNKDD